VNHVQIHQVMVVHSVPLDPYIPQSRAHVLQVVHLDITIQVQQFVHHVVHHVHHVLIHQVMVVLHVPLDPYILQSRAHVH
jgi:hypothetical protein